MSVSEWHKMREVVPSFVPDSKPPTLSTQVKTLSMQRDHLVYAWRSEIEELRSNAKVLGPHTRKYYESCADSLEKALDAALKEMKAIRYEEVE